MYKYNREIVMAHEKNKRTAKKMQLKLTFVSVFEYYLFIYNLQ